MRRRTAYTCLCGFDRRTRRRILHRVTLEPLSRRFCELTAEGHYVELDLLSL